MPADRRTRLRVDGHDVAALEIAGSMRARSRGLLGRDGLDGGLWLAPARQVHTFRMRFAIDVAHVGADGRVLATTTMPPGRLGAVRWCSKGVLEASAGMFSAWGLVPRARLDWD